MNHPEPFRSLPDMLDEMPAPGEPVTDRGKYLEQTGENEFTIRGIVYLPVMDRIWATFVLASFPSQGQYDYLEWRSRYLAGVGAERFTPDHVATMSLSDCHYLLRMIQRAERFCDGAWAEAYADGLFHAVARRLVELAGGDKREAKQGAREEGGFRI